MWLQRLGSGKIPGWLLIRLLDLHAACPSWQRLKAASKTEKTIYKTRVQKERYKAKQLIKAKRVDKLYSNPLLNQACQTHLASPGWIRTAELFRGQIQPIGLFTCLIWIHFQSKVTDSWASGKELRELMKPLLVPCNDTHPQLGSTT